MTGGFSWRTAAAVGLVAVVLAEVAGVAAGWLLTGMSSAAAQDSFLVSNAIIALCCGLCGGVVAAYRPDNRLGWLLLGAGVCQAVTAAVTPWLVEAVQAGGSGARALATLYSAGWPWSIALFIPLALLSFPDGRLPGRRWRWLVAVVAGNAVVQVLIFSADPDPLATVGELDPARREVHSYLELGGPARSGAVELASQLVLSATFLSCLVALVLRYRRGTEQVRRQLLWLLLATTGAVALIAVSRLGGPLDETGFPVMALTAIALVPAAMAIAVLRHGLLDIRLVWSRALTYGVLTAALAGAYLAMVQVGDRLLGLEAGLGTSILLTLLVAVAFDPLRRRLQRAVDRLLYGQRTDPVRAARSVTAELAAGARRPADVLPALCQALRLPYARLVDGEVVLGEHGERPDRVEVVPLRHAGTLVGELVVGVRSGQGRLHEADRAVLDLMAVPIGVAVRASALSEAVQASRRAIVEGREEERRRLRRDLHDGLGPVLTAVAFQADAVVNLAHADPAQVSALGAEIRVAVGDAIADVRHLIHQLRPAALDELGLVEAVRRHAQRLDRRADGASLSTLVTAADLPPLPAAVEVTAYRIVTEALTNVARHSTAACAEVVITPCAEALRLVVRDDGAGSLLAAPTSAGGEVVALLPVGVVA